MNATTATPTDGITGDVCPVGHFCPMGSSDKTPCPTGTYLEVIQQDEEMDCKDCPLGDYCPGVGREWPIGNCSAGYYCPGRQNMSQPHDFRYI